MGYSYKFIYRNDCIRKDKTVHVLLRVTIDRETLRHKTGIFIDPNKWDLINQRVKGNSPITNAQNKHLKTIYVKAVETFTSLEKNNQPSGLAN